MGVKRGVPDLVLPVPSNGFHGLYIELKTEKGKPSAEQTWWLSELSARGYKTVICYGFEEAVNTLISYLSTEGDVSA